MYLLQIGEKNNFPLILNWIQIEFSVKLLSF